MNKNQLLKALMDRAGVGQSDLKRATGVPQSTISRFSSGTTDDLTIKNATALAKHFAIPAIALLDNTEADACARRLGLLLSGELVAAEASPAYTLKKGWPFSAELWHSVSQLDQHQIGKLEALMRVHLDLAAQIPQTTKPARQANGTRG